MRMQTAVAGLMAVAFVAGAPGGPSAAMAGQGALVEGGWFSGDSRTNYLGSYTFTSFADFEAGRPSTYTQRIGNPRVEYTHWQAGIFIQDDWRALKNLTISAGLRHEIQTHLGDRRNLVPSRRIDIGMKVGF